MGPHRWSIHCSQVRARWRRCVTRSESPSRGSAQVMPRRRITRPMRTSRSPTTSTTFGPSGVSSTHSRVAPWLESRRATRPSRSSRIPDVLVRLRQRRRRAGPDAGGHRVRDHDRHRGTRRRRVRRTRHHRRAADGTVLGSLLAQRFLVAGSLIMGVFTLLGAFATSFGVLVAMRMVAGVGSSVIWPNVTATVGDNFSYRDRGPAMSTVIGLNTMASVVGVPLAGIVAEGTTWRASVAIVGLLSIAAALLLLWKLRPAQVPVSESKVRELYRSIFTNRSAVGAIGSSLLGSLYWFTWSTYIVVFFELTFKLSEGIASTIALTLGLGVLVGSQFGGRLGTRIGHKP